MDNKTESYIILKPIAERFNRIAKEITDEEIKQIITSELRNQINRSNNFGSCINGLFEEWLDDNEEVVHDMFKKSMADKLSR